MSSAAHRSAQEKSNLLRIRDNQRRSRARRKEYLQELENRVRSCEHQGVEASSEIQLAARRVSDENRKLRLLLNMSGIFDATIEQHLATTLVPDNNAGPSVALLEELLQPRKCLCPGEEAGPTGASLAGTEDFERSSSRNSSSSELEQRDSCCPPPQSVSATKKQSSLALPKSNSSILAPNQGTSMHNCPSASIGLSSSSLDDSPVLPRSFEFDFGQGNDSYDFNNLYFEAPPLQGLELTNLLQQQQTFQPLSQPHTPFLTSSRNSPALSNHEANFEGTLVNNSSCHFATDMIRTLAGVSDDIIRAELGCRSKEETCEISDQVILGLLEKFSIHGN